MFHRTVKNKPLPPIILASSSKYRKNLLKKTGLRFRCYSPSINESKIYQKHKEQNTSPRKIIQILAEKKAQVVHERLKPSPHLIISGDQMVAFGDQVFGKPKTFNKALQQLQKLSGKKFYLYTSVHLLYFDGSKIHQKKLNHQSIFQMRKLSVDEIKRYLKKDKPYDCAGSCRIEGAGLLLFSKIVCNDFSAIEGLPLLWLTEKLKEFNYELF